MFKDYVVLAAGTGSALLAVICLTWLVMFVPEVIEPVAKGLKPEAEKKERKALLFLRIAFAIGATLVVLMAMFSLWAKEYVQIHAPQAFWVLAW